VSVEALLRSQLDKMHERATRAEITADALRVANRQLREDVRSLEASLVQHKEAIRAIKQKLERRVEELTTQGEIL
jgi:predicted  nucleic acid-binding Zn-ribbon protein